MDLKSLFLNNVAQTSDFPLALEFTYAEGSFLFDKNHKAYLDLISGISVSNIGHRHPKVVKAIKDQADSYLHQMVYGEYVQAPQVKLAGALVETLEKYETKDSLKIDNVYFTNSGTEAVEGAMKLAKRFTGRQEFIAIHSSYHGSTQGALSLGDEHFKRNFRPLLPSIKKIERNKVSDLEKITSNTAAIILEVIGAESGIRISEESFIKAMFERCKQTGTLVIFDEIQTGFGRTGTFWAFEHFGLAPDILLSAKGMGGGMPIGAFMAPREIMGVLKDNPILGHITTFGGHPVSCAASLATLEVVKDILNENELIEKSKAIKEIFEKEKDFIEVRGRGMLMAAEMDNFQVLKQRIDHYIDNGIITDWFLYCDNAMRIAPPINITWNEIDMMSQLIKK